MSRTKSVGFLSRGFQSEFWVYDDSLAVLLALVIRTMEATPITLRPTWWSGCERDLRIQAVVSDFYFDLETLFPDAAAREDFAALAEQAADELLQRGTVTAEDAAAWIVLDDNPVIFRGSEPLQTGPIAELGHALASLIRGTLPPAPPGTWWFYGAPEGRTTVKLRMPPYA